MKIKICGLTKPEEADYLNENEVDYAGFVLFFPKSKRNNTIENARKILSRLSRQIKRVAVTVSPTPEQIHQIQAEDFDLIQIHGSISSETLQAITLPVLKAFNVKDMTEFDHYQKNDKIIGYVFDAQEPGSGSCFDWSLIQTIPRDDKLLFLAGGLNSKNVAKAIQAVKPDAVDTSSGVENDNGIGKDPDKISKFCFAVRTHESTERTRL